MYIVISAPCISTDICSECLWIAVLHNNVAARPSSLTIRISKECNCLKILVLWDMAIYCFRRVAVRSSSEVEQSRFLFT